MLSVPAANDPGGMSMVALPLSSVAVPKFVLPLVNPTAPVGAGSPFTPLTVTVTANGCALVMLAGEGVTDTAAGYTPTPLSPTFCGEPLALSVMTSIAVIAPAAEGVKLPPIVQFAPAARLVPHEF
jgi:hypothetical protein